MSRCCAPDRGQKVRRAGRVPAAGAILQRWLWLGVIALTVVVAFVWFTFGPGRPTTNQATAPATLAAPAPLEGPRIEFDETYFDFGQVPTDENVEHTFTYRNVGNQPLILQKEVLVTAEQGC